MNIVCIVQARMGSSRLPGKVLKDIFGKTVLEHDIDRLKRVKNIHQIVIATTELEMDNVIVEEAERLNITCFRGNEEDVLSRYYYAAKENCADVVVRVTSDCPLIDSNITEEIISFYLKHNHMYDYVSNTIERTYPRGLDTEVFSFSALEKAFNEAVLKRDREHVTPYIWDNPSTFKIGQVKSDDDYSALRWTIDTVEDFKLINIIYSHLYSKKGNNFNMEEILKLYDSNAELYEINSNVVQKI